MAKSKYEMLGWTTDVFGVAGVWAAWAIGRLPGEHKDADRIPLGHYGSLEKALDACNFVVSRLNGGRK
jgi:hypothetical protein